MRYAFFILSMLIAGAAEAAKSTRNIDRCLDQKVTEMILKGLAEEAIRKNGGSQAAVFYLPDMPPCTQHGALISAGAPRLVEAYWKYRKEEKLPISCPAPFASVKIETAPTPGCRPIANGTPPNACALKAFDNLKDDNLRDVRVRFPNGIVDREFYDFARFHMAANRQMYKRELDGCF